MTVMMMMAATNVNNLHSEFLTTSSLPHHHYPAAEQQPTTTTTIMKGKKPYKSWLKDGVNGGPSSMEVLVTWLSSRSNYKKWKREDYSIDRVPKKELLEEIIDKLRQVGIYHRLSKDVASKISTLQSNYRLARKWNETEGRKLRESGRHCRKAIYEELLKRFPYWEALHPVFGGGHGYHRNHYCTYSTNMPTKKAAPTHITNHQIVFNKSTILPPSPPLQQYKEDDYSLTQFILKCQKKERNRMEQFNTMLNKLRQDHMQKIQQEKNLLNQEKLQAKLYYESCLSNAGFTETERKDFF